MKKSFVPLFFVIVLLAGSCKAQLVSYTLLDSFSTQQLDSLLDEMGAGLFISPDYPVDFYRVIYKTPYKHPDSLVKVSGAVVVPRNPDCSIPLACYTHGTITKARRVPSNFSLESNTGILFASKGAFSVMPDYLGLGFGDSIPIHPYIDAFSQAHTTVNLLRAARILADSLGITLNDQLFLAGYSQGGFATVATHKLIEEEYSDEFTITASAAMSGAYDLKEVQPELILSDSVYASPAYLPYIILGYQSIYGNLYDSTSQWFKPPYDSLLPSLFYGKQTTLQDLNTYCEPVPKHMLIDSVVDAFQIDSLHPLRVDLAKSHQLDWAPLAPIRLIYCHGDEQVTYLNSIRAYDSWTNNGATQVEKQDLGNYTHGGCIFPAIFATYLYFDSFREACTGIEENGFEQMTIYPNPAEGLVNVRLPGYQYFDGGELLVYDALGRIVLRQQEHSNNFDIETHGLDKGLYLVEVRGERLFRGKMVVR